MERRMLQDWVFSLASLIAKVQLVVGSQPLPFPCTWLTLLFSGNRIKIWHYLPPSWSAQAAVDLYKGVVTRTLRRCHGNKRKFAIMEDNDPTGYKSNRAKEVKAQLKICPIEFPRYAPDLMPLDYSLWAAIERKMAENVVANESVDDYKKRPRRVALGLPEAVVKKAVMKIPERAAAIAKAKGGDIARD